MKFTVERATGADRDALDRLMQLYLYDFSEFTQDDLDSDGRYGYRWLDAYFADSDRHAFVARVDNHLAGFALVRTLEETEMAEFFIVRKYRRAGLGTAIARDVLARFPGKWRVKQLAANTAATRFWQAAIPVEFEQQVLSNGASVQHFSMPKNGAN